MLLKSVFFIGLTVVLLSSFKNEDGRTRYFLKSTVPLDMAVVRPAVILTEGDSIQDTLYQVLAKDNTPVAYYRAVTRSVCFDKQCRILKVNIYWNITGRYLGFELPKGEFLSKAEHEPFQPAEYKELNRLLADSLSPLKNVKPSDMIPKASITKLGVDGVTSPTSGAISEYVVKGAGYTTYAMWHLIYGDTQKKVIQLSEKVLNNRLLLSILNSDDVWDKQWAMNRLRANSFLTRELEQALLININDDNFSLAENTIRTIKPEYLASPTLQAGLLDIFNSNSYNLKNSITLLLTSAPSISPDLRKTFTRQLNHTNGSLFLNILHLFCKLQIHDDDVLTVIEGLSRSSNKFISTKATDFLKRCKVSKVNSQ